MVWGSGRQTRSFIHARDAALAMKLVTERAANEQPINLGPPMDTSIAELVSTIANVAGYQGKIVFDTSRPEGPSKKFLALDRLYEVAPELRSTIPLGEGLRETIHAFRTVSQDMKPSEGPSR